MRCWPNRCDDGNSCSENSRSEEHTSELQSQSNLVCRLLLEKKKEQQLSSLRGSPAAPAREQISRPARAEHTFPRAVSARAPSHLTREVSADDAGSAAGPSPD